MTEQTRHARQEAVSDGYEPQRNEHRESTERQRERKAIIDAVRAAHADAFARPLIDSRLLTPTERKRIHERVSSSGQRSWSKKGASL